MLKKIFKILGIILLIMIIIPYFIPREPDNVIPDLPFENSIFFTTSDGVELHAQYYDAQNSIGKVIMVHGLSASSFSYRNNAPALKEAGYDVLVVDLPAFGYSSKERDIDHSQVANARYLWEWMLALDVENQDERAWHLVGHSMGGSTVLALANQNPDHVSSINLIAPAIVNEAASFTFLFASPLGEWLRVALNSFLLNEENFTSLLTDASNQVVDQSVVLGYLNPLKVSGSTGALLDFVLTSNNVLIDEYQPTEIPFNLFWGENDTWVSVEDAHIIQEAVTVSNIHIFANEGHLVHETSPDFNQALIEVLAIEN